MERQRSISGQAAEALRCWLVAETPAEHRNIGRGVDAGDPRGDDAASAGPVRPAPGTAYDHYTDRLLAQLRPVVPRSAPGDATMAILTPGQFKSACCGYLVLADKLGFEHVQGRDLQVRTYIVCMRAREGERRVDVI